MAEVQIINASIDYNNGNNNQIKYRKKKVCAYCRVSTDMDDQRTSYESQISHYGDFIKNHKGWDFAGIYADDGITGTMIKNRNEFIRMIDDCKAGKIDIVIAKSISRFARNTVDTLNTVRMLRDLNIDVFFEKENIHTLNMDSEMFLTLYSAFAQAESESTSMNVKMGYRAKMKRGEPCGSISCYGYRWNSITKEMEIQDEEAQVLVDIFNWYIRGLGSTRIANKLTENAVKAPDGGYVWHPSVIKGILRNVKYIGDLCGQKCYVENPITHKLVKNRGQKPMYYVTNHHKPIINRNIWNKVQEIYEARSTKIKNGKEYCEKFSMRYAFSSMIKCGCCGGNYVRRVSKYKNKDGIIHTHVYWACTNKVKNPNGKCSDSVTIRDEEIKSLFVALFNKFLNENKNDELIKKIRKIITKDNSEEKIKIISRKIDNIREKMSKLIDLKIDGIDEVVYTTKMDDLREQLRAKEQEKENVLNSKMHIRKEEQRLKNIEKELINTTTTYKFDEEVFKKLISKVIIGEFDESNKFHPDVVKFVLNVRKIGTVNSEKFLSLEVDERNTKTTTM